MLLHAQANSPAQTQPSPASTLQSKLAKPKEFVASEADHGTIHPATSSRISTGVTAPRLISTVQIESDYDVSPRGFSLERKTVISMFVDATGKPSDLKIVKPINPVMDKNVLAAVSQYRFAPGTLDGEPTIIPVNLEVVLRSPSR